MPSLSAAGAVRRSAQQRLRASVGCSWVHVPAAECQPCPCPVTVGWPASALLAGSEPTLVTCFVQALVREREMVPHKGYTQGATE